MIERLPYYYRKSQFVKDAYNIIRAALDRAKADIYAADLLLFIATTDDFTPHEKDVGLTEIVGDAGTKRARVIARLQGNNLLTRVELENLIRVYDSSGCTVKEDFASYTVTLTFNDRPHNLDAIKFIVEEVKPAHIQIKYEFLENTWNAMKRKLGVWSYAKAFTWGGIRAYNDRIWLYADIAGDVYLNGDGVNGANAYVVFIDGIPYARLL